MINYIWAFMMLFSIIVGCINGRIDAVVQSAFDGADLGVKTVLGFIGITAMWSGFMKIAENSGLVRAFTKLIRPLNRFIFPGLKNERKAMEAVSSNMVANMLGLSNAATPLGIKAMKELDRLNNGRNIASDEMCMFAVINAASIQLLPSTIIGIRASLGSIAPAEIIVPVWIVSFAAAFCGITLSKILSRRDIRR